MLIEIGKNSVKVIDSYKTIRPKNIIDELIHIYYTLSIPNNIKDRKIFSLFVEWTAHNMLYYLGYKREQTRSVDFDNEPMKHLVVYFLLMLIYCLGFWIIAYLTNKKK